MGYKVETFGEWEGTLEADGRKMEGTGRKNFTVNTKNPPQVVADVRRVGDIPFRLVVRQGQEPEKTGQD